MINSFKELFENFERIPKIPQSNPTYMEIAGYPHYENVCSNILNFYFDTGQPHNLKDLFLKSFLECLGYDGIKTSKILSQNCIREYVTDQLKRIDLVIECEDLVIAVENKIFHWLHNDLEHYEDTINNHYPDKVTKKFVVLSIKKEETRGRFTNVTYELFFRKLKQNLGYYAVDGNNQYVIYLLDFIKSIENLYTVEDINKDMFNFITNNEETIKALNQEANKINERLVDTVKKLLQQFEPSSEFYHQKWIWNKNTLVFDFKFDSEIVALDITIGKKEITADIFQRNGWLNYDVLDILDLIKDNPNKFTKNKRGYLLYTEEVNFFEINTDQFLTEITHIIEQIRK